MSHCLSKKTILSLALAGTAIIAQAQKPRIAILEGGDKRHATEFDLALEKTGWSADRYSSDVVSMKNLAGKLDSYDMLIATPLFNWGSSVVSPSEDREAYMEFLNNGGLIVMTDANYGGNFAWFADIDPAFGHLNHGKCNSSQWIINGQSYDTEPPHPMRFFPSKITEPNNWGHIESISEGSKWSVVAYCNEGHPVTVAQSVGKGMIYLTTLRQSTEKQMVNFFANLQLIRSGVEIESFEMSEAAIGSGVIKMTFAKDVTDRPEIIYEVASSDGKKDRFSGVVEGKTFELSYYLAARGTVTETLYIKRNGQENSLFIRSAEMPQLLTVRSNAYRGILSTERRLPEVKFGVEIVPDTEVVGGGTVALTVYDSSNNKVSSSKTVLADDATQVSFRQPVALDQSLAAGVYTVEAVLIDASGKKLAKSATSFKILAPQPGQTIVDEDNTLLVDGKPFFPMGIYHISPNDYPRAAEMGMNTVQFWSWDFAHGPDGVSQGLTRAGEYGLKALVELNHKTENVVHEVVTRNREHPSVLMWYGLDEPSENSYGQAKMMMDIFHKEDEQRPVYLLSCRPDVFDAQSEYCDVFAMDPYGDLQLLNDWMTNSVQSVKDMKPVICVPGSFGDVENEDDARGYRASAYLVLASNGRGIIWYPWCQVGGGPIGDGIWKFPEAQNVVSQICWEVKALVPALVSTDRRLFASEDGKVRAMYTLDSDGSSAIILGSSLTNSVKVTLEIPGEPELNRTMSDYFGKDKNDIIEIKNGKFEIELNGRDARAYR